LSRGETAFLSIVALSLLAAVCLLPSVGRDGPVEPGSRRVGTITFKNRHAERKGSGNVLWNALEQSAPVYDLDSIRTAESSSAIISLDDAAEISLGEESLVLLDFGRGTAKISVEGGSVAIRSSPSAGGASRKAGRATPLVVSTRSGQASLKSGTLTVSEEGGGMDMSLSDGSAVFNYGTGDRAMEGSGAVSASGRIAAAPPIETIAPECGSVVLVPEADRYVGFRWKPESPGGRGERLFLTIASDRGFARVEYSASVAGDRALIGLAAGTHYWKLTSSGDPAAASPVSWFTLDEIPPPRLIAPLKRQFRVLPGSTASVDFSWTPSAAAASYRLRIASGGAAKAEAFARSTASSGLTVDSLKSGEYSWTVTSLSGPRLVETVSPPGEFSVVEDRGLALLRPRGGETESLSAAAVQNGAILATWDEVDGADGYVASISRDAAGRVLVDRVATGSTALQLNKPLEKGDYFLTVRAIVKSSLSPPSAAIPLTITDPFPPTPIVPVETTRLDPGSREVAFKWADRNLGRAYRLQVAGDRGFARMLADRVVSSREAVVGLPEEVSGDIAWKVSLLDGRQEPIAVSPVSSFYFPPLLGAPQVIFPADGEKLDINATERIAFRWKPVSGAEEYRVVLYRLTGGLKSTVQSWKTKDVKVVLDRFEGLAIDSYSWELRAAAAPARGYTGMSRGVDSYFQIVQSAPLPAPRITIGIEPSAAEE
jgi:hypothetical protein